MLKILPYKKELLEGFVYDGVDQKLSKTQIIDKVDFYNKLGECFIGFVGDEIIGVGGIYTLWEDAGSLWLFLNKKGKDYKKSVFKVLLTYMNELVKKYKIKTLVVECLSDCIEANRLIQHLGFVKNKEFQMNLYLKNTGE